MIVTDAFCFVPVPKTGSSWVTQVMKDRGLGTRIRSGGKHEIYEQHWFRDRTVFTVVRHPRTWLPSAYRYMRDGKPWQGLPGPASCLAGMRSDTFQGFVERVIARRGVVGAIFGAYTDVAQVILRNESLAEDLGKLLGCTVTREPYNVSRRDIECEWGGMLGAVLDSERDFVTRFYPG